MASTKSKADMKAEARAKAKQYRASLSPATKTSRAANTTQKTTSKTQNKTASSHKKTPRSVQLAKAREYGDQLKMKKSSSPVPEHRVPVSSVSIPLESQTHASDGVSQQSSGSFETADWAGIETATQTESRRVQELKMQAQEWESIRDQAEAARKRLVDQINNEGCDMDIE